VTAADQLLVLEGLVVVLELAAVWGLTGVVALAWAEVECPKYCCTARCSDKMAHVLLEVQCKQTQTHQN